MVDTTDSNINTIGRLNDRCRQGLDRTAKVMMTHACLATFTEDGTSALAVQIGIVEALPRGCWVSLSFGRSWRCCESYAPRARRRHHAPLL